VDLVPAVLGVAHPRPDHFDSRALGRDRDARAVLRDDLDHKVAADARVPVREKALIAGIRPEVDMDVPVVGLEHNVRDGPDRHPAAALHL
jgi:hypothetical protein